mmetsp:Transcript_13899/g.20792  ORF Transcript_13899/g.20792 Transcript_13899/m.20792 type:complete len:333 (+) Transcript_13899:55-1053(+)
MCLTRVFILLFTLCAVETVVSVENDNDSTRAVHLDIDYPLKNNVVESIYSGTIREGMSGAFAGAVQVFCLMWLRTTVSYQYKYGLNMRDALRDLYIQGGIKRFYRGLGFALVQAPLAKFGSVAANDCIRVFGRRFGESAPHVALSTAMGSVIAALFRMFLMPIDTCKTVLQVDGSPGYNKLMDKVWREGKVSLLYQGTVATMVTTVVAHYPWYLVHNFLDSRVEQASTVSRKVMRSAGIALVATVFSDVFVNVLRVLKTVKQTTIGNRQLSYVATMYNVFRESGLVGLLGRGLSARLAVDVLQSVMFTIIWKVTSVRENSGHHIIGSGAYNS